MHQHIAHPPGPDAAPTLLDNISDTLLNAFARVRKPDERFVAMKETIDKFEESLNGIERTWGRERSRTAGKYLFHYIQNTPTHNFIPPSNSDLSSDYHELAVSVQGLGFLESGITDPLNHFSSTLLEFSTLLRHTVRSPSPSPTRAVRRSTLTIASFIPSIIRVSTITKRPATSTPYPSTSQLQQTQTSTDPFMAHLQSLIAYAQSHKAVLKLRDQKQLDFEELSDYLTSVTAERDRLAAIVQGHAVNSGFGLGAYLRDRVDALRGADDDRSRVEKMRKLDSRIKEASLSLAIF